MPSTRTLLEQIELCLWWELTGRLMYEQFYDLPQQTASGLQEMLEQWKRGHASRSAQTTFLFLKILRSTLPQANKDSSS